MAGDAIDPVGELAKPDPTTRDTSSSCVSPRSAALPLKEQELIAKWREREGYLRRIAHGHLCGEACRVNECANELAALLTASPAGLRTPEICICAAVMTEEGFVIRGHRHHDALHAARQAFCKPKQGEDGQGFVTSQGRYVTREEGYRLHVAADIGSCAPSGYRGERLFSEDLY